MIYVDTHTHTINSPDGHDPIISMVKEAQRLGLSYLCTTDHLDYDLKYGKNRTPIPWNHIDLEKYKAEWIEAKKQATGFDLCFGIEAGFDDNKYVQEKYIETINKYDFDEVINSVHFVNGMDVYFPMAFFFKTKKKMYGDYLDKVIRSLDAPYQYDIIAHVGYVTRNAPYKDKSLSYDDFPDKFDAILKGVIEKGKALEVNTHHDMNPIREVLERYYELGGRKISFGSDSHRMQLIKDYDVTCDILRDIGFTHFSTFYKHKEKLVPIGE